jgi:hypothetical protein
MNEIKFCEICDGMVPVVTMIEDGYSHKFCEWCWTSYQDWELVSPL